METITSGPECKCACIAPPSAVNPCEGEYRLKKLREAGNENVKVKFHPVPSIPERPISTGARAPDPSVAWTSDIYHIQRRILYP